MLIKKRNIILKTQLVKKLSKHGYFGKITAFDENHGIHDFRVSVIFYCPYASVKLELSVSPIYPPIAGIGTKVCNLFLFLNHVLGGNACICTLY